MQRRGGRVEPLVIPLRVVMSSEISGRLPERPFSEEDHPVETFILESVGGVSEVPADLHHPGFVRAWSDPGDRRSTDSMSEVLERTPDPGVSPPGILSGHPNRQLLDDLHDPASPWAAAFVGPLLGNELPVPTKDGVGSDERGNLGEGASPDNFAPDRKPPTLSIGQAKSSATELLPENSVLLAEVLDDRILLTGDPASQRGHENLPRLKDHGHLGIVACKLHIGQRSSTVRTGLFSPEFCPPEYPDHTGPEKDQPYLRSHSHTGSAGLATRRSSPLGRAPMIALLADLFGLPGGRKRTRNDP